MLYRKSNKHRGCEHPTPPTALHLSWGPFRLHGPSAELLKILGMLFGVIGLVVVAAAVVVIVAMGWGLLDELALLMPHDLTVTFRGSLE